MPDANQIEMLAMGGQLFTQYFLTDGIRETDAWKSLDSDDEFAALKAEIKGLLADARGRNPNEAATEQDVIRPIFDLLGWNDYLPQQRAGDEIPDHLLFADAQSKRRAEERLNPSQRIADALVISESKRLGLSLDKRDGDGTPHNQILRYLDTAAILSDGNIRYGILTNGGVWRLYDHQARPRATAYCEANLENILLRGDENALRAFYLLFRRAAFIRADGATATFVEDAIAEGRRYEERVANDLSGVVFNDAFPSLVSALSDESRLSLSEVRSDALFFLYRLLFILSAEDRGLLPVNDPRYDDYGLRKSGRDDIARRMQAGDAFSSVATTYYDRLTTLFNLLDKGDPSIGLPPYNGGLFASESAPILQSIRLPDAAVAPIIYNLSHTEVNGARRFVNYRDLSVQQFGSIYERLMEREPTRGADGKVVVALNRYARKDSGSFYTHQQLVDLIVERTIEPLVKEREQAFIDAARALSDDGKPKSERLAAIQKLDPAAAVLNLKVLDPSMGSGHFLVTAVDFISDRVAELVESAANLPDLPDWAAADYVSPLAGRIDAIRDAILARAAAAQWALDETQLTDRAIIRRMALKRCIYGVDKNPLTVELAKVSLWLHSFTAGAPLSFLDHHLRRGDSLLGLSVSEGIAEMRRLGGLAAYNAIHSAENAADDIRRIEELSDADVSEVRESSELFQTIEGSTADLRAALDFLCGLRWNSAGMKKRELAEYETPLAETLDRNPARAYELLSGQAADGARVSDGFAELRDAAMRVARREDFIHWELAFPGVWRNWQSAAPEGGFDAIIGNPPWDRVKLQEVEWFSNRASEIAYESTNAARQAAIGRLIAEDPEIAERFDDYKALALALPGFIRASNQYPLLSGGDINLYSLFVERSMRLLKPDGLIGLLTPSGIYADKTAARFFKEVSISGRVDCILDFENGKVFFTDVDTRFKFCVLVLGGERRKFEETQCAFFLEDVSEVNDPNRCFALSPEDFARVNPNTAAAPVFRSRRDADITRAIYENHPVLVNRSSDKPANPWPVRYRNMFHMTKDSYLFRTADQLREQGFYPVSGNKWKRGDEEYLPLYEGKMVQAYDHRAASVVVNPANLHRPNQPLYATPEEHMNADWLPKPLSWVPVERISHPDGLDWVLGFKHVTSPTNARTMIACIAPKAGYGNSMPVFMPKPPIDGNDETAIRASVERYKAEAYLLAANFNSMAFDFVTRQKVQGQNLNLYILEQLPVIAIADYERRFGETTARDLARDHALRLTYTARDMAAFARDMGYEGEPFAWDDDERSHLRARLDALYFHLYGLSREDASYIMDTFKIVRDNEEDKYGFYRHRELALAYMNALAAGDAATKVAL